MTPQLQELSLEICILLSVIYLKEKVWSATARRHSLMDMSNTLLPTNVFFIEDNKSINHQVSGISKISSHSNVEFDTSSILRQGKLINM